MSRKTVSALPAALASATTIALVLTVVDFKKITYTASVNTIDVCTDLGKPKVFADADSAIKLIAGIVQGVTNFTVSVTNPSGLEPGLKLGDPIAVKAQKLAKATAQVLTLTSNKTDADARVAAAKAANWDVGNALEVATYNELVAVQTTINEALVEAQARKTANT